MAALATVLAMVLIVVVTGVGPAASEGPEICVLKGRMCAGGRG